MKKLVVFLLLITNALTSYGAGFNVVEKESPFDNGSTKAYQFFEIIEKKLEKFNTDEDKAKYLEKLKDAITNFLLNKHKDNDENCKAVEFLKMLVIKELSLYTNPIITQKEIEVEYEYPEEIVEMYSDGNLNGVINYYLKEHKKDEYNLIPLINLAYSYYNLEDYDNALIYLNKILELDKTNNFAIENKLNILTKNEQYYAKIDFLKNLIQNNGTSEVKTDKTPEETQSYIDNINKQIGDIYLSLGDYENSEIYYIKLVNLDKTDLLDNLNSQKQEEDKTYNFYKDSNFTKDLFVSWVSETGKAFQKEKKFISAIRFYNLGLEKYDDELDFCDKKANIYIILEKYEKALEIINNCLEKGKSADLYFKKAEIYNKKGEETKALQNYIETIKLAPQNVEALKAAGVILENQNKIKEAKMIYQKAYDASFDVKILNKIYELEKILEEDEKNN
ncbi:MAG: tetratricopeptide repeat protein [Candidatus Gracilibacteria bacterium]|nr:tetratricopeptide repeat protein [Candidatus Gracilibacteria bacterium]